MTRFFSSQKAPLFFPPVIVRFLKLKTIPMFSDDNDVANREQRTETEFWEVLFFAPVTIITIYRKWWMEEVMIEHSVTVTWRNVHPLRRFLSVHASARFMEEFKSSHRGVFGWTFARGPCRWAWYQGTNILQSNERIIRCEENNTCSLHFQQKRRKMIIELFEKYRDIFTVYFYPLLTLTR